MASVPAVRLEAPSHTSELRQRLARERAALARHQEAGERPAPPRHVVKMPDNRVDFARRRHEPAALDGPGSGSPSAIVEDRELGQIMRDEIRKLPDREKLVLSLYYDEGLTLSEIGEVLGVTESRVSQIHTKSVLHLRSRLSAAGVG